MLRLKICCSLLQLDSLIQNEDQNDVDGEDDGDVKCPSKVGRKVNTVHIHCTQILLSLLS